MGTVSIYAMSSPVFSFAYLHYSKTTLPVVLVVWSLRGPVLLDGVFLFLRVQSNVSDVN